MQAECVLFRRMPTSLFWPAPERRHLNTFYQVVLVSLEQTKSYKGRTARVGVVTLVM